MKSKDKQYNSDKTNEYKGILNKADELVKNNHITQALSILDEIPKDCPEYSDSLFMKSMIVANQGDMEESFKIFQKFLAEEFGDVDIDSDEEYRPVDMNDYKELFYCGLTDFYFFNDYEGAIEYFNKSLRLEPNQDKALYYKALSFAYLGWLKKAVKIIDKAIEIEPDSARYLNDRGVFLSQLKQVSKAHQSFDKAMEIKPNSCSLSNKGILYLQNDQFDMALESFDEAIKLDSQDIFPVLGKVRVYLKLGDFDKVDEYFDMASQINSGNANYLSLMGKYLLDKNEFKKSIEFFDRCLEIDEKWAVIWMYKSMALSELGRDAESQKCFKQAIDLDPSSIDVFDEVLVIED